MDIGECEVCGRRIKITTSNNKYCDECAKEEWRKYNKHKQKQYYNQKSV